MRKATRRPLVVKLSPNAPDLVESARAAHESGADILSLVNTFVGMAIDPETAKPRLSFGTGGLSGPAIKPLALRMVYQVARALPGVPIMGIGGIACLEDVLEFLAAGASAVQIGTANFKDPGVSGRLVSRARGVLRPARRDRFLADGQGAAMKGADRICVALDFPTRAEVLGAARRFGPKVGWLKIGLEAFVSEGPSLVREVAACGARVFLDLKLHDIPRTVERAVRAAARSGAAMVNVHASGGRAMLEAARRAITGPDAPLLVAVTLLTSLDARALADLPMAGHAEGIVRRLARLAQECGLEGVVCSPTDLAAVRGACGEKFLTVVPGIRPAGHEPGDQRRIATPAAAIAAGADILVVGRPITGAQNPEEAVEEIAAEIESAHV